MPRTLHVTDLDGTLLSSDGRIGAGDADRLRAMARDGVLLTYATARSHARARAVAGPGWGLPAVVYNGAFTVDPASGAVLRQHRLAADVVDEVLALAGGAGIPPLVFDHSGRDRVQWRHGEESPGIARFLADRPGDPRLEPLSRGRAWRTDQVFYVVMIGSRQPLE